MSVPEPSTLTLSLIGLAGAFTFHRLRKRRSPAKNEG
jgi:hypothetical protein